MTPSMTVHSEETCVAPLDEAWFSQLYDTHNQAIYRYFARRAPREDCEDLTADVFATAWRRREDLAARPADGPDGDLRLAWLYRTAGLILANYRRKHQAVPVAEISEAIDQASPELALLRDEDVREALAALPPRDRAILVLVAWEGVGGAQLAEILGMSRGGADAAISRARARLREAWAH